MKIQSLVIKNFKSIRELSITDIDNAFIFVGKNNSGKSSILDAIRAALGDYQISERDFNMPENNIVIGMTLHFEEEDLQMFHTRGIVSKMKKYDMCQDLTEASLALNTFITETARANIRMLQTRTIPR